jgi:hypothetical protein
MMILRRDELQTPVEEEQRVLDRLVGLEAVIAPETIQRVLKWTDRKDSRTCQLSHEVMLWIVLAMGLFADRPIRQVFKASRRLHGREQTPHRSSLCIARQRLGVAPLRTLFREVVRPLATPAVAGGFYRGYRLVAIDGNVLNLPDTPANELAFGRPSGGTRGAGAFPQCRKTSLVELGTHVELAFVVKPIRCGETTAMNALWSDVPQDSLLLWDRGFFSYSSWKTSLGRKVQLLCRVKKNMILKPIESLSDGSYLAKIYPSPRARQKDRTGLVVRVIRYKLDDPQRVGHEEEHVLMTTLLDAETDPAEELIVLYHQRWEEEITFDEQKTHQDPRRATKTSNLRSETPAGVVQELYALSIAHFIIRKLMFDAAQASGLDPDRLSFTGSFQILTTRLPECDGSRLEAILTWYENVLWEISQETLPPRRNRINPRVIKQKMSNWPKKRRPHFHPPPLTKTFAASIVIVR